jgi:putative ABC transport system permease protein
MATVDPGSAGPPRRLERLAGWLIAGSVRESALGDLAERYRSRFGSEGVRGWYVRQALSVGMATRLQEMEARFAPRMRAGLRGDGALRGLAGDGRLAVRGLVREPGVALVSVLTLALGMGATSAIFSVVNPVLFESLPYREPERLVMVWEEERGGTTSNTGYATFADVREDSRSLESVAAMGSWSVTVTGDGRPERLLGQRVTAEFFGTLGARPALGRDFLAEEDGPGAGAVVILSHGLWRRRYGGDPGIVGRSVTLSGDTYEVVGVMPAEFESLLAPEAQLWRPLRYDLSLPYACRTCRHLRAVARLAAGVSVEDADREVDALSAEYVARFPTEFEVAGMRLEPLQEQVVKQARPALRLVLGAAGLVLLIACANVANLLIARAVRRAPEFAVRSALGAGRWRVARQLLVESVILGLAGGAAGLMIALWGLKALVGFAPPELPRLSAVTVDRGVLLFTGLMAVGAGLAFGMLPALLAGRIDLARRIGAGLRVAGSRRRRALRRGLVVSEVALALALAVAAGLLVRSLGRLLDVKTGFEPDGLLTMETQASGPAYDDDAAVWAMQARLLEAVAAVPGVASAALASQIPLGGNFDRWGVRIEEKPLANPSQAPGADRYSVTADYLVTMGIPVLRGRGFTPADRAGAVPVVLINESFAERSWPGEDPLGRRVQLGAPDSPLRTIVGIVGDVRHTGLDAVTGPQIYMPMTQSPFADGMPVLVVRSDADPAALAAPVSEAVWSVDRSLAISRILPAPQLVRMTAARRRFALQIFSAFAIVALLLAGAGIYGVLSGTVAERTREIGVRTALGATRRDVLGLVIGQGMRMAGMGLALGIAIALSATRLLRGLLFGVQPTDPVTVLAVSVILGVVAIAASAAPAWRAARTDPMKTLRGD